MALSKIDSASLNMGAVVSQDLGTPTVLVATNVTGTANALNAGIGVNQTWQAVTRTNGTTYTNNTGKPITLFGVIGVLASGNFTPVVAGYTFPMTTIVAGSSCTCTLTIPVGATYSYSGTAGNSWSELR